MTHLLKPGPNGSVIEIDPQLLSDAGIAGIAGDAAVEIRREGDTIMISAADEMRVEDDAVFEKAVEFTFRRYDGLFKRLSE